MCPDCLARRFTPFVLCGARSLRDTLSQATEQEACCEPREARNALALKAGDRLLVEVRRDNVILLPKPNPRSITRPSAASAGASTRHTIWSKKGRVGSERRARALTFRPCGYSRALLPKWVMISLWASFSLSPRRNLVGSNAFASLVMTPRLTSPIRSPHQNPR